MPEYKPPKKKTPKLDPEGEARIAAAKVLPCPKCRTEAHAPCQHRGQFQTGLCPERLAEAEGVDWRNKGDQLWRLGWGQRRADPELRFRRVDDEENAA
ncbi:MAG: hypothetical protein ACR2LK_06830 [Solirubrobacteraceae bacterium]